MRPIPIDAQDNYMKVGEWRMRQACDSPSDWRIRGERRNVEQLYCNWVGAPHRRPGRGLSEHALHGNALG